MKDDWVFAPDVCAGPECTARVKPGRTRAGVVDHPILAVHCSGCRRLIREGLIEVTGTPPHDLVHRLGRRPDGTWRETYRHGRRIEG
jgi:hypothetical protein